MPITFRFGRLDIKGFRGIRDISLQLPAKTPTYFVGPNNAGKSTVLSSFAFALKGGGFHTFVPTEDDFFRSNDGSRGAQFQIDLLLEAESPDYLPAVQGVGKPILVHGLRVLGRRTNKGRLEHRHVLTDEAGDAIVLSPRTNLSKEDKKRFKDHGVGWAQYYARLEDIREHLPEVWLLTPENLERSLYTWQTGPLNRLAKLLSAKFMDSEWKFEYEGEIRKMPNTLEAAHRFFRACVSEFPFWKEDMRPRLEEALGHYLGRATRFELQPDVLHLEAWLQQQLALSFAGEASGTLMPLPTMGHGWQALVRLAALEVIEDYAADPPATPVVLLCEEPEVYLHPHLRRKLRDVLERLSARDWLIIAATHATDFISFNRTQQIVRLWREDAGTQRGHILTDRLPDAAKFQSRLDERGTHELVLANRVIIAEGRDDVFALRTYLDKHDTDLDGRGVTIVDVGGCGNEPAYAQIASELGIPWCGLTDEDLLPDGSVKPATAEVRKQLADLASPADITPYWPGSLEAALNKNTGKADPEWQRLNVAPLSSTQLTSELPAFVATADVIRQWINS